MATPISKRKDRVMLAPSGREIIDLVSDDDEPSVKRTRLDEAGGTEEVCTRTTTWHNTKTNVKIKIVDQATVRGVSTATVRVDAPGASDAETGSIVNEVHLFTSKHLMMGLTVSYS